MVLYVIIIIIAAIANSIMDLSSEDRFKKPWWNKNESWRNKWSYREDGSRKEKFPLSSTVLVFLTDGWHLSQFIFHSCWQLVIALILPYSTIISFLVVKTLFSLIFEAAYRGLKK